MLNEMQRLCERNENLSADDLRRAAATMIERQFLYADKRRDREVYRLIGDYQEFFRNLFDALNLDLICDPTTGYAGVLPRERNLSTTLDTEHTLFLLTLRIIYERGILECRAEENAQVLIDSTALTDIYETHSGRDKPGLVRLRDILRTFSRQGLLDLEGDEDKLLHVRIRPAIRNVVTPAYLQLLEDFARGVNGDETEEIGGVVENSE